MSATHGLNGEGEVVCEASPRPDGSNTTSTPGLISCGDCIERLSDEAGICRECGEDLPEELLRYDIDYHPECAGVKG